METVIIERWKHVDVAAKAFDDIAWVLRARNKKDITRQNLMLLEVNEGTFTCVDGSQLHSAVIDPDSLPAAMTPEDGLWSVVKIDKKTIVLTKDQDDLQFPNWKECLPTGKETLNKSVLADRSKMYHAIYSSMGEGVSLNADFIDELIISDETWDILFYEPVMPVKFESGNKKAVIMPMKA
jgi:hypothetical protein